MTIEYKRGLIHEYLQRTAKPVQLVKHFDEVIDKHKIYPLIGQVKKDGVYALCVSLKGRLHLYGRTGLKLYWELDERLERDYLLVGGVYIVEVVNPALSLEELSGLVNPNRKKAWLDVDAFMMQNVTMYFHDYLTFDELLGGHSDVPYMQRYAVLQTKLAQSGAYDSIIVNKLIFSADEAQAYADELIGQGEEGAVFKRGDSDWVAGHKGYRSMKIVKGVSLDLLCTGVQFGKGKREGQIAALEFSYKGSTFKADLGKGWTDERREELTRKHLGWINRGSKDDFNTPVGHIWEVKALDISSTGKALRLPKVVRIRWDKEEPDT